MNDENKLKDELVKIRIEHIYKNMNDILKEVRFLDKISLVGSGIVWGWIVSQSIFFNIIINFIPAILTVFIWIKATLLLEEYKEEKLKYKKFKLQFNDNETINENKIKLNHFFYTALLLFNMIVAIYVINNTESLNKTSKCITKCIDNKKNVTCK